MPVDATRHVPALSTARAASSASRLPTTASPAPENRIRVPSPSRSTQAGPRTDSQRDQCTRSATSAGPSARRRTVVRSVSSTSTGGSATGSAREAPHPPLVVGPGRHQPAHAADEQQRPLLAAAAVGARRRAERDGVDGVVAQPPPVLPRVERPG